MRPTDRSSVAAADRRDPKCTYRGRGIYTSSMVKYQLPKYLSLICSTAITVTTHKRDFSLRLVHKYLLKRPAICNDRWFRRLVLFVVSIEGENLSIFDVGIDVLACVDIFS